MYKIFTPHANYHLKNRSKYSFFNKTNAVLKVKLQKAPLHVHQSTSPFNTHYSSGRRRFEPFATKFQKLQHESQT
jgi:hypothetical protein